MRCHLADKAQWPYGQRCHGSQRGGQQQNTQAHRRQGNAHRTGSGTAEWQDAEPTTTQRRQRNQRKRNDRRSHRLLRRHRIGGAGNPGQQPTGAWIATGQQQENGSGKRRAERNTGQQHTLGGEASAPGGNHDHQQGSRGAQAACRQQPDKGITRNYQQHHHHAKGGSRADTQDFRAGHWVTGQFLD
ncbi:hypothetical protein D3C73_1157640 [compost metagenome]